MYGWIFLTLSSLSVKVGCDMNINRLENVKSYSVYKYSVHNKTYSIGPSDYKPSGRTSLLSAVRCKHKISHVYFQMHVSSSTGTYSQLSYIGQDCRKIPPVLVQLYSKKVHHLDLSYNSLTSLQGIEKFSNLQELVLDNNCLSDSVMIPMLPRLQTLSLNKNNINNLELLLTKVSRTLPRLNYLSLLGNLACPNQLSDSEKDEEDYQRYRYYVIYRLPGLKFLDSKKISAEERKEAEHRGQFMKTVRPGESIELVYEEDEEVESNTKLTYTPLPSSSREIGDHQGAYGRCRYRYSGKHSEGNRFIQNHDL